MITLDATQLPHQKELFAKLFTQHPDCEFEPERRYCVTLEDNSQQEVLVSHHLAPLEKPTATKKEAKRHENAKYYCVLSNKIMGTGNFGSVVAVKGTIKVLGDEMSYKTKKKNEKLRLIKIGNGNNANVKKNFAIEQAIGSHVPHMSMKYPVTITRNNINYLVMRHQPGKDLEILLDDMYDDPDLLSVSKRLELCIALIDAVKTQVHDIKLGPGEDAAHIVHSDLKPANIIVDTSVNPIAVKIVDYGLSDGSDKRYYPVNRRGSPDYKEPKLLERMNPTYSVDSTPTDTEDDLFAIGIILTEIWDANFREQIEGTQNIIRQNKDIPLDSLFEQTDIDNNTKGIIHNALYKMTRYEASERLTQAQLREEFEKAMASRFHYLLHAPPNLHITQELKEMIASPMCPKKINIGDREPQSIEIKCDLNDELQLQNLQQLIRLHHYFSGAQALSGIDEIFEQAFQQADMIAALAQARTKLQQAINQSIDDSLADYIRQLEKKPDKISRAKFWDKTQKRRQTIADLKTTLCALVESLDGASFQQMYKSKLNQAEQRSRKSHSHGLGLFGLTKTRLGEKLHEMQQNTDSSNLSKK